MIDIRDQLKAASVRDEKEIWHELIAMLRARCPEHVIPIMAKVSEWGASVVSHEMNKALETTKRIIGGSLS